ncbi:MAG: hypothetical protein HYU66_00825, partial [Armatimonadetes bacterium]|nr:hypothetical protein [Armatimonadota bacterium]
VFSVFGTVLIRGTGLMLFTLLAVGARLDRLARPGKTAAPRTEKPAAPAPEPEPVAAPEVAPGPTPEDLAWEAELAQIEREAEAAANNPPQESSKPVDDKDAQGG